MRFLLFFMCGYFNSRDASTNFAFSMLLILARRGNRAVVRRVREAKKKKVLPHVFSTNLQVGQKKSRWTVKILFLFFFFYK